MRKCFWILGLALATGCADETPAPNPTVPSATFAQESLPESEKFFTEWLKSHGHTDVVVDEQGVGIGNNPTRLSAFIYGSNQLDGGRHMVELECRIRLSAEREIIEFVAGLGDTEQQAIDDALLNFALTTFHVVYKGFMNADDPHMTLKPLEIDGQQREVIAGDVYVRSVSENEPIDLPAMNLLIESALADLPLTPEPHWIKIIYSQQDGKPQDVSGTIDNDADQALSKAIEQLAWPHRRGFYMVKQFIVINEIAD